MVSAAVCGIELPALTVDAALAVCSLFKTTFVATGVATLQWTVSLRNRVVSAATPVATRHLISYGR